MKKLVTMFAAAAMAFAATAKSDREAFEEWSIGRAWELSGIDRAACRERAVQKAAARQKKAMPMLMSANAPMLMATGTVDFDTELKNGVQWYFDYDDIEAFVWYADDPLGGATLPSAIVVPEMLGGRPVTALGLDMEDNAFPVFGDREEITSVSLPSTLKNIAPALFMGCVNLRAISTIPASVTNIGALAFCKCPLSAIEVAEGNAHYKSIDNVLYSKDGKRLIQAAATVTAVAIPDGVEEICDFAFAGCDALASVTIPSSVTRIGHSAFSGCAGLTRVRLPEGLTELGDAVFAYCDKLLMIRVPDGITRLGQKLFEGCGSLIEVAFSDGVTEIGSGAFCDCAKLVHIEVPDGVTEIKDYTFKGCAELTSVRLPSGVTAVGAESFVDCERLHVVVFEGGEPTFGYRPFGCSSPLQMMLPPMLVVPNENGPWTCEGTAPVAGLEFVYGGSASATLVVVNGGDSGVYEVGQKVEVSAANWNGYKFVCWQNDTGSDFGAEFDISNAVTTVTIPAGYSQLTATFAVEVAITGHTDTQVYDGQPHTVSGFDVAFSSPYYTADDFGFSGTSSVTETTAGDYPFNLAEDQFTNNHEVFKLVRFRIVKDGGLTITEAGDPFGGGAFDPDDPNWEDWQKSAFDYKDEYDGQAHTIDTNALVAAAKAMAIDADALKVEYSLTKNGTYTAEPPEWTDVCATSLWYRVSAENCADYVHEAAVIITKKPLAETMIGEIAEQTYTGAAIEPVVTVTDGEPSIIKTSDYTVSYADNVAAGTARVIVTATADGNYSGAVEKPFTIAKAGSPFGGGELDPDDPSWEDWRKSAFDYKDEYDGSAHTIDTNALVTAAKAMAMPGVEVMVKFYGQSGEDAASPADDEEWSEVAPCWTDAGTYTMWYRVSAENCADYVHEAAVIIIKKPLAEAMIADIDEQTYTGAAIEPAVVVTDGEPSIIKASDYTVSYADNVNAGTARAIVTTTADGNYSGTVEKNFTIAEPPPDEPNPVEPEPVEPDPVDPEPTEPDPVEPEPIEPEPEIPLSADIAADIGWKYLKATGTWFAQIKVTCTDGLAAGIDNLRFLFADRTDGDGTLRAALWSSAPADRCAVTSTTTIDGVTCRFVDLDATKIAAENSAVAFGVGDLGATTIPVDERTVEIYTRDREIPVGDGCLVWESGGQTRELRLMTAADANDLAVPHSAESSEVLADGQMLAAADPQMWSDGTLVCVLGARIDDIPLPVDPMAWTVVVKKMPTGIKYDRKRGCLTGVPRKVGTFTMTATAKNKSNRKDVRVWTQTVKVLPLPKACVGRFTGKVVLRTADPAGEEIASGVTKLTVSKSGKVSGNFKLGKMSWRFAATELELEVTAVDGDRLSGEVVARTTAKCGKDRMPIRVALCPFSDTPSDGLEIIDDNTYLPDIQSDWQGEGRLDMSEDWFVRK